MGSFSSLTPGSLIAFTGHLIFRPGDVGAERQLT